MGILQRVMNMTKAAANEMLDKMENPVMMLNHYLRDLDEEIERTERTLAQQQVQERLMGSKLEELHAQANYYEGKAVQAAREGREAEARMALEAKLLYLEQAEETVKLRDLAKQAANDLQLRVESLKEEKTRLQGKRAELMTRVRQMEASGGTGNNGAGGYGAARLQGSSAAKGFERIEQKVMEWEAARELAKTAPGGGGFGGSHAPVDLKHEQRSALVEEQLRQLLKKPGN
ncbi:PspA/IM30 family protein [Paenibacillus sp. LHD-117]|uniref:PspA/IM30 family protein n=1 Tax=Paenibacillus sp. LHD-117 TaxID=3071412 RepID=UPI0027E03355|nr:PspA/IM30 family protein [Paenibacillus sp. LHD-117]MDQ6422820.1 PspA/IM30 family protein [Paenibacillus sp. LHD-117]